jgi:hypothetical protein
MNGREEFSVSGFKKCSTFRSEKSGISRKGLLGLWVIYSESGFSADKRCDGWKIWQKRNDRIETATMCKGVWHNLLWLGGNI